MEELRSTEILDREIQDDARRKAEKILAAGDAECAAISAGALERIESSRREKKAEYEARLADFERDTASAIPLEKERRLVAFIDASVREALGARFAAMDGPARLAIYGKLLRRYAPVFDGRKVSVRYSGCDGEAVTALAQSVFGANRVITVGEFRKIDAAAAGCSDGLFVEAGDRSVLCRASIEEITAILLENRRQELAEALFGGRLPS